MRQSTTKRTMSPIEQVRRRSRAGLGIEGQEASVKTSGKTQVKRRLSAEDERLLTQIMGGEQDFIDSPAFYEEGAEVKIYDDAPDIQKPDTSWYHPVMDDLSSTRNRTVKSAQQVILTGAEEKVLFHQFNYARYRIWKLQHEVGNSHPPACPRAGRGRS